MRLFSFKTSILVCMLWTLFGCKDATHREDSKESLPQNEHQNSSSTKPGNPIQLFGYTSGQQDRVEYSPTLQYSLNVEYVATDHKPFDLAEQDLFTRYPINKELVALAKHHQIILADMSAGGVLFEISNGEKIALETDKCLYVAYDLESEIIYSHKDYSVDHFFLFVEHTPVILFSGQICLTQEGKISKFVNSGLLSTDEFGIENFLQVLVQRGAKIDAEEAKNSFHLYTGRAVAPILDAIPGTKSIESDIEVRRGSLVPKRINHTPPDMKSPTRITETSIRESTINKKPPADNNSVTGVEVHANAKLFPWADPNDLRARAALLLTKLEGKSVSENIHFFDYLYSSKNNQPVSRNGSLPDGSKYVFKGGASSGGFGAVHSLDILPRGEKKPISIALKTFHDDAAYKQWKEGWETRRELPQHLNVMKDFVELTDPQGRHIVIMERLEKGFVLEDFQSNKGNKMRLQVMRDMIAGVQHLHGHGLVHRDIKLENVMASGITGAKLVDLDGVTPPSTKFTKSVDATQIYKSPELQQLTGLRSEIQKLTGIPLVNNKGLPEDWRGSDVYALGLNFLEMKYGMTVSEFITTNYTLKAILGGGEKYRFYAGYDGSFLYNKMKNSRKYTNDPEFKMIADMLNPDWKSRIDMKTVQEQFNTYFQNSLKTK